MPDLMADSTPSGSRNPDFRFPFTQTRLANLPTPLDDRATYHDAGCQGLSLRISPSGIRTFTVLKRVNGRPSRMTIGRFPDITVEVARKEAQRVMGRIAAGGNPAQEKRTIRQENTLDDLFCNYLELHAKVHKKSWKDDVRRYQSHLAQWGKRKVSELTTPEIQAWHARLGKSSGMIAANRSHALLRTMFNFARVRGFTGLNPAQGIKHFREQQRARFMDRTEIRRFMIALLEEPDHTIRDFFKLALFTGARRANVLAMRWENLDLDRGIWRIPGEKSKTGDPLQVVLVPAIVDLLRERRGRTGNSPWVLPSPSGGDGHYQEPKMAWARILARAELRGLCEKIAERDSHSDGVERLVADAFAEADRLRGMAIARRQGLNGDPLSIVLADLRERIRQLGDYPESARMSDLRIHDLRRTLGSWQAAQGASLTVIGASLGHKQVATTAIYARINLDPVRESVEKAASAMLSHTGNDWL